VAWRSSTAERFLVAQIVSRRLIVVVGLADDYDEPSLDVGFDFQAASHRLIVVEVYSASFDVGFDLQAASHRLIVVEVYSASFDVRFDFHT
jgi:hypothetical protein